MRNFYKQKDRQKAALIALIGGVVGAHKFYLRDIGAGIFYLILFFITSSLFFPITLILGVLDSMRLLMMPAREFDRKYNRHLLKQKRGYSRNAQSKVYNKPKARPKSNPFKKSGLKKYKEFDLEEAIKDFVKAEEIDPQDEGLHFNMACTYSLTEQKEKAYSHLQKAVNYGFKDFDKITAHDDLAFIRIQPEFEAFKNSGYTHYKSSTRPTRKTPDNSDLLEDDILLSQLNKLSQLRKKGLLSSKEFELERKKLLRR